jgi:hypothetical protein
MSNKTHVRDGALKESMLRLEESWTSVSHGGRGGGRVGNVIKTHGESFHLKCGEGKADVTGLKTLTYSGWWTSPVAYMSQLHTCHPHIAFGPAWTGATSKVYTTQVQRMGNRLSFLLLTARSG